ncbi:MAG: cation diffusion facilitator family transporter [Nanoarchaeota archaeon]
MQKTEKITIVGLILNSLLFISKLVVGLISGSLALLSDAFNSLTDVISSIAIFIAVKVSCKKADKTHPFGHRRAEPLAGVIVAIFAGILGFEIFRKGVLSLFEQKGHTIGNSAIVVLIATIIVKILMSYYFIKYGRKMNSPAIKASGIDSRNDVLVSLVALIGVICSMKGMIGFDSIAAIIISFFILFSGYKIGSENINYLMGTPPSKECMNKIKNVVRKVNDVKGINDMRAHYVGSLIHIEIHIEVPKKMTTLKSHKIGKIVEQRVEELDFVEKAFIHIDPR